MVTPPRTGPERERVRMAVHELLGERVDACMAIRRPRGERALLRVPGSSTGTVLEHLAARGVPARAVLASRVWTALPLRYYALLVTMTMAGVAAGQVAPPLLWAAPATALWWWFMGFREIRRPALVSVGLATALPAGGGAGGRRSPHRNARRHSPPAAGGYRTQRPADSRPMDRRSRSPRARPSARRSEPRGASGGSPRRKPAPARSARRIRQRRTFAGRPGLHFARGAIGWCRSCSMS